MTYMAAEERVSQDACPIAARYATCWARLMISRASLVVGVVVGVACSSALTACSSDDGKPSSGTSSGTPVGAPPGAPTSAPTGSSTGTSPPASIKKALIEGCVKDEDCASGICYAGDQGSYCSIKCTAETAATVCVAPMAGTCNKKGFCKKP